LPSGGRTPPSVMPIDSPHEPASGGNENSPGGAPPLGLLCSTSPSVSPLSMCSKPTVAECCTCFPVCHARQTTPSGRATSTSHLLDGRGIGLSAGGLDRLASSPCPLDRPTKPQAAHDGGPKSGRTPGGDAPCLGRFVDNPQLPCHLMDLGHVPILPRWRFGSA
jgi:hypothetical protein